ncbi:MAG: tRNA (guanosine(46)-N7)-methyltransferase TrmB [Lentimicrobiaceae bacterium]|nr:tRNA (guanosine(46)-N7)-methyltransferase TrmB [Lentimicrobiaceae bacterium]
MSKNKLEKFAENAAFPHFFQPLQTEVLENGFELKGKWRSVFFNNNNPIVLELACGRGEYTVGLAAKYPNKNFIGIDRKGARMWTGGKESLHAQLPNVAFLRTQIGLIKYFFAENEVDEIWITFPDPQPARSKINKRLTSPLFLDFYKHILKPNGLIHLKTDSGQLYEYTLEVIENLHYEVVEKNADIYAADRTNDDLNIQTYYETMWRNKGIPIKYIQFSLNSILR